MANTYHQIYLQTICAVKFRKALLADDWRPRIQSVIGKLINDAGCQTLIVNGTEDHVHSFFALAPKISVSELLKGVKAKSSKYINDHGLTRHRFEWQPGYGVFSYSKSSVGSVYRYIQNQEEHHRKYTFQQEYVRLLEHLKIPYDERYLFAPPT